MEKSKNDHSKLNEGGKLVIDNPEITKIISNNKETKPIQYEEKVDAGVRSKEQPLKDVANVDENKAQEAGSK